MKRFLRDSGLSLVMFGLFIGFELGLSIVGQHHYNQERVDHGEPTVPYVGYLTSSAFLEATMENWESEFFQMFGYVFLTVFLFQRGSAESKSPDEPEAVDRDPRLSASNPDAPWPVRKGGAILVVYEYSLSIALFLLFAVSFYLHALSGARQHSEQELLHGGQPMSALAYLGSAQFWFESLQNWQSEFFSIATMVVLSIFLRQRGSPESKPVDSPHRKTGE